MRRSDIIEIIYNEIYNEIDEYISYSTIQTCAKQILSKLEDIGMLPPSRIEGAADHDWDDEETKDEEK